MGSEGSCRWLSGSLGLLLVLAADAGAADLLGLAGRLSVAGPAEVPADVLTDEPGAVAVADGLTEGFPLVVGDAQRPEWGVLLGVLLGHGLIVGVYMHEFHHRGC